MNARQLFKKTVERLGFAGHQPDQMTNSDYWLCTVKAMEEYSDLERQRILKIIEGAIDKAYKRIPDGYVSEYNGGCFDATTWLKQYLVKRIEK